MSNYRSAVVIGGNAAQLELSKILSQTKSTAYIPDGAAFEKQADKISRSDLVFLPLPISKNGSDIFATGAKISLESVKLRLKDGSVVLGGSFGESFKGWLKFREFEFFDFYADEAFKTYNAALTAQAALRLILENSDDAIFSKKVLLTGFGNVSKALARLLKAVGADVYIAARSQAQRSLAFCCGYKTLELCDMGRVLYIFDFIVNTVASNIFSYKNVTTIKDDALFVELASKPFGALKDDFELEGKKYLFAPSLPGRFYPKSVANAILKSCRNYL